MYSFVTFKVWRNNEFDQFHKISQSVIIWLIPILGALGIWVFIHSGENPRSPYNSDDGQGNDRVHDGVQ